MGDHNAPWYDKPAVEMVRDYVPVSMPPVPDTEPPNYHNPYNLPTVPWLTGSVEDQHGHPMKEVNARIWCESRDEVFPEDPERVLQTFHSAYTDADGDFIFFVEPTTLGYIAPSMMHLLVIGAGTDQVDYGVWNWPDNMVIPNEATHVLETHPFLFSGLLANKDIFSTEQEPVQRYHAWTDLKVQDVTVHAGPDPGTSQVEIAARHSIHITGEFHAQAGSEVHIRTLETFPECGAHAFKSLLVEPPAAAPLALKETAVGPPHIELQFMPLEVDNALRVFPNPFRDAVEVHADGLDGPVWMELLDGLGRVVHREDAAGSRTVLSLPHLAPGPYRLLVRQGRQSWSNTLIKQP